MPNSKERSAKQQGPPGLSVLTEISWTLTGEFQTPHTSHERFEVSLAGLKLPTFWLTAEEITLLLPYIKWLSGKLLLDKFPFLMENSVCVWEG